MSDSLIINEIFTGIQGESSFSGFPCTFVRLAGCPRDCSWCDTPYARTEEGRQMSVKAITDKINCLGCRLVEITGGEPLAQEATKDLVESLCRAGNKVLVETSGTMPIAALPTRAHIIMDLKCPGSGMDGFNHWDNLQHLKYTDEIKFVIADRADFDWTVRQINAHDLSRRFKVVLSCAFGLLDPKILAEWLLASSLECRMQLQIHKYIWDPDKREV